MRIVAVMANKGGVGKTSITLGLAGAAAVKGMAVLVIDLDPQGNATSHLRTRPSKVSVVDVLEHPTSATLIEAISVCDWDADIGEVDIVPSSPDAIRFDAWRGSGATTRLARALQGVDGYDLVLIDCPPSLGALTREALTAADAAVIVTSPSYFGLQGVERSVAEINEVRSGSNSSLKLVGVIVNRVRTISEEHAFRARELGSIVERIKILKPFLPDRVAVQQAEGSGVPVQKVKGGGAKEVSGILDGYLRKILK
ncbi:MAG: ParA family protein [Candidatus Nanopelagicales bacterium]|jgi:cellulose biosynthesis protein BcsQ|nr:ParA family protein [Candidatus Nanopelagicales bacterium]